LRSRARGEADALGRELGEERARRAAAEAEATRLRGALLAVPQGVVLADAAGMVMLCNPAAVVSGHGGVLLDAAVQSLLSEALAGRGGEQRVELVGPPRRVLVVRAIPLAGSGALVLVDDLSERVRLDAVRTDFVANISHELKTPVGALSVLAETLADSDDLDVNRRLAEKLVAEAHRASSTIDDLLELSRIELGGRGDDEMVPVAAVFSEVAARHRLAAEHSGVNFIVAPAGDLTLMGDRRQLVSAVSNLVDNAIKYTDRGGTVGLDVASEGGWVDIHVSDSGVGIPARDLDRVFERFYRVDRARSRATGGTGLGLAIVRHVAANHGGEVTVRSREGEGSTFTLRLPVQGDS